MVTQNIEEAVLMCDRILVLGANPVHIAAEIPLCLPQPRNCLDATFHAIVEEIYFDPHLSRDRSNRWTKSS